MITSKQTATVQWSMMRFFNSSTQCNKTVLPLFALPEKLELEFRCPLFFFITLTANIMVLTAIWRISNGTYPETEKSSKTNRYACTCHRNRMGSMNRSIITTYDLKHALIYHRSLRQTTWSKSLTAPCILHPGERSFTLAPLNQSFLYGDLTDIADSTLWMIHLRWRLKNFKEGTGSRPMVFLIVRHKFSSAWHQQHAFDRSWSTLNECVGSRYTTHNYLLVNIPEFRLHIIESDTLAGSMNIVVGNEALRPFSPARLMLSF